MTTKLTYWGRSPQLTGDCTSGKIQEGIPLLKEKILVVSFYTKVLAAVPDLAWCLLPSEPHSEKTHLNSPPQLNFALKPKFYTKILAQHSTEGNSPQVKQYS